MSPSLSSLDIPMECMKNEPYLCTYANDLRIDLDQKPIYMKN